MTFSYVLRSIAVKLERRRCSIFHYPIEKQKKYIAFFPEPKDDFQRSYCQYKCQMKFYNLVVFFVLNLVSLPLIFFYLFKKNSEYNQISKDSVFFSDGKPENIIPNELRRIIGSLEIVETYKALLTKEDKRFVFDLWKNYPFSFHFILKCLLKVKQYSYEIHRLKPLNIVVCNEYSFTSSVLTQYCEKKGIKHINVMHGEKLYYMRDSFFRFHECYVWDEYYKKLFIHLRAEPTQFKVAVPPSLKHSDKKNISKTVGFTYYLGVERGERLRNIVKTLEYMRQNGLIVAIRPHPRYTDLNEIYRIATEIEIENLKKMTIEQSLKRTKNAISLYSTVLNQAYNNAIGVVIDDVSDKEKYNLLRERAYIMLNKPHKLLSQLLEMKV